MSKNTLRWSRILLSGVSFAAMGGAAFAQEEEASDEIVVTATGRAAAIQDVPIAVTAVTGETVQNAGVENLLDLQQLAPSLRIFLGQSSAAGTLPRIRGLGTGADNPGFESAVGIFIDGVYRARAGIAVSDLPEVERIEVLRGPQGTLFGRNTSSGAVNIVTAGPNFETGAWMEASGGDLGYGAMRAGVNIPFDDAFAVRLDGSLRARDGFLTDALTGQDYNTQNRWSARAQALWDISPSASLRVIVDGGETDEDCCAATIFKYGIAQPILDNSYLALAGTYAPFLPVFAGPSANLPNNAGATTVAVFANPALGVVNDPAARTASVSPNRDYLEQVEEWGLSGELDWEIGGLNLTSISAYRTWDALRGQDVDFSLVDMFYRDGLEIGIDVFTQEFRLQGEVGRLNWLVGAFYSQEDVDTTDRIRITARAADFANALTFLNFAGTREIFNLTNPIVDGFIGGDPVPSVLGLINPAFDQVYLTPNPDNSGQQADNWTQSTEDISIFTHNEINLSDNLVLTAGLRYNQSSKEIAGILDSSAPTCDSMQGLEAGFGVFSGLNAAANGGDASAAGLRQLLALVCSPQINTAAESTAANPWRGSRDEDAWSGTLSLAYHVNEDVMLYGGYSRGYKAGGFNLDRSGFTGLFPGMTPAQAATQLNAAQLAFEPEFVDAYELGVRSTIFGGSTYFNVTAFYQELHDYQLNAFNGTAFITRNIPEAVSQGVEIDVLTRPFEGLTVQAGLNYTDAFNDSTVAFIPNSPADTIIAGTPLVQAPEWSITGAVTYEMPLGANLRALFFLDARYDSEYQTQSLGRDPISDQPATTIFNGRIGIGNPNGRWGLEIWGRNLTDEFIGGGLNVPLQPGTVGAFVNEPRTWGATLRARY